MPSSVIYGMLYSPARRTLDVVFQGTHETYRYYDVCAEEWQAFRQSPSKGTYLNAIFKARHPRFEKLSGGRGGRVGAIAARGAAASDPPAENMWGFDESTV